MSFRKALLIATTLMMTLGASMAFAAEGAGGDAYASLGAALASDRSFRRILGQGKTAAAALEGIARNPAAQGKIFVPISSVWR